MKNNLQDIFSRISDRYELVNHILTFGMDIYCRNKAAKTASREGGRLWLDICTGTGEMAKALASLAGEETRVIAADFTQEMLKKAQSKKYKSNPDFILSDAVKIPLKDSSLDLITISFATRNITTGSAGLLQTLKKFRRILKPGGRFVSLETSQPSNRVLKTLYHFYVRTLVSPIGYLITGSGAGHKYLSRTIRCFYAPYEFSSIILASGFREVCVKSLFGGIAAIHMAVR